MITTHNDNIRVALMAEEQIEGLIIERDMTTGQWHWHYQDFHSHTLYSCSDGFSTSLNALIHFTTYICEELKNGRSDRQI